MPRTDDVEFQALKWSSEFLTSGSAWVVPVPVTTGGAKQLKVRFNYASGGNGLDIEAVDLLADGKRIARDRHAGFTGTNPKDPVYQVAVPAAPQAKLTLRITVRGASGNDSRGEVMISAKH